MRRFLCSFLFIFLPASVAAQDYKWDFVEEKEYHKSAVSVTTTLPIGAASGTGVIIQITEVEKVVDGNKYNIGYILTCFHVVEHSGNIYPLTIGFRNGGKSTGQVLKWDVRNDWAIVQTLIPTGYCAAEISDVSPKQGDKLECVGLGGSALITSDSVRRFSVTAGKGSNGFTIRFDDVVVQGDSGGPVFLNGKLVGLMRAGIDPEPSAISGFCKGYWGGLCTGMDCFDECLND